MYDPCTGSTLFIPGWGQQNPSLLQLVCRRSDNKDAMKQECLGPSSYSKGQGTPVRIWGMLACGGLSIHVLEDGETMNADIYAELVV